MQSKSDDTSKVLRVEWSKRLVGQSLAGGKCISIKKESAGRAGMVTVFYSSPRDLSMGGEWPLI